MNNTQVQLSKSKVLILSIPREDYWIFSTGIFKLLNQSIIIPGDEFSSNSESEDESVNESESSSLSDWSASSKNKQKLLDESVSALDLVSENEEDDSETDEEDEEGFYHVAFTPNECTIIFSEKFAKFFTELILASETLSKDIKYFPDLFYLLEIAGDGLNIGRRVLDITEPLSKADISLFFLSNYFSDIVLIPETAKDKVITLLEEKGFSFSNSIKSYNAVGSLRNENEVKQEDVFKKFDIKPTISSSIKLLLTGARSNDTQLIIEKTILAMSSTPPNGRDFPKFFSITKTMQNEVLLMLPRNFSKIFKFKKHNLVGSLNELMIPINIDLFSLPIDIKGIVSGTAKKLIKKFDDLKNEDCEMSYLSMGRSSIVMIPIENIDIVNSAFQ